jgi:hypothetical protein
MPPFVPIRRLLLHQKWLIRHPLRLSLFCHTRPSTPLLITRKELVRRGIAVISQRKAIDWNPFNKILFALPTTLHTSSSREHP